MPNGYQNNFGYQQIKGERPDVSPNIVLPQPGDIDYSDILAQQFQSGVLPYYINRLHRELPQIQLPEYRDLPTETQVGQVGFLDTMRELFPEFSPTGEGEYIPTSPITLESIEKDPAFRAFRSDLERETGRATEAMIEEMARRGITSSTASERGYEDILGAQTRAITGEIGRLQSPLVRDSILQQAIEEPIRRSRFNTLMANRMLGLGTTEREILQEEERERARFATEQFLRRQARNEREAGLPTEQELQNIQMLGSRLNLPLSIMTGIPFAEQSTIARERMASTERQMEAQREAMREAVKQQNRMSLYSGLGSIAGAGIGAYLSPDPVDYSDILGAGGGGTYDFGGYDQYGGIDFGLDYSALDFG